MKHEQSEALIEIEVEIFTRNLADKPRPMRLLHSKKGRASLLLQI
jgi:hypothetical protein